MTAKTVRVPRLLEIRAGALDALVPLLESSGFGLRRTVVGTGGRRTACEAERLVRRLREAGACAVVRDAAPTVEGVTRLVAAIEACGAESCVAVGGGRVIDAVKQACALTDVPFVSVPTALAHDGVSSPIASLVDRDGRRTSVGAVMPDAVVVDLDVVRAAPARASRAGAADLLSNLTALEDWRLAVERGADELDGFSALVAEEAARSFLYLAPASTGLSLEMLARGLVLSGLAMATAGSSRPCSGAEHLISHSLDRLLGPRARLHGEQVALGLLIAAVAQDSLTPELVTAYRAWSLPRSNADLALPLAVVVEAVVRARAVRPGRYTVLDELDLSRPAVETLVERAFSAVDEAPRPPRRAAPAPDGAVSRSRTRLRPPAPPPTHRRTGH